MLNDDFPELSPNHVWRARIILATAERCSTVEIMRSAGVSKPCVWRWQERFMQESVPGHRMEGRAKGQTERSDLIRPLPITKRDRR
jgi:hypothetical protein